MGSEIARACRVCGAVFPLTGGYWYPANSHGHWRRTCKRCIIAAARRWQRANPDARRAAWTRHYRRRVAQKESR